MSFANTESASAMAAVYNVYTYSQTATNDIGFGLILIYIDFRLYLTSVTAYSHAVATLSIFYTIHNYEYYIF